MLPKGLAAVRFRFMTTDASAGDNQEDQASSLPPADQRKSRLAMIGPTFTYDARDSQNQPRQGIFGSGAWLFGLPALGNSFRHSKLTLTLSAYTALGRDTVLATNARLCSAWGDVPYYDLCQFGSNAALRGYPTGRYRERASWAAQAELRQHLGGRWGATAFAGLGGIARSPGRFASSGNLLPAAGVGLRYQPFKENDVQIRVDAATGIKGAHGFYLGIGEAF